MHRLLWIASTTAADLPKLTKLESNTAYYNYAHVAVTFKTLCHCYIITTYLMPVFIVNLRKYKIVAMIQVSEILLCILISLRTNISYHSNALML